MAPRAFRFKCSQPGRQLLNGKWGTGYEHCSNGNLAGIVQFKDAYAYNQACEAGLPHRLFLL